MYTNRMVWKMLSVLVLTALLAGCGAPTTVVVPTSTPIPTIDPLPTFNAVSTQAAQTVVAELTKNAPTATPVIPTETPAPTNTPAPTETPAPTSTATRVFIPWTQTPTATVAAYGCAVTSVSPKSSDTIKVDQDFDASWTVKNTGTQTWVSGNVDILYGSGTKMHTSGDAFDLQHDVAPNGTYTFTVDMKAPSNDGSYSTSWGIHLEDGSVCTMSLNISVSK